MCVSKLRILCLCALSTILFTGTVQRVWAQGTTGTILGTVTDSSGGAIPDATVRVTNSGTNATQVITSDAQGRYRLSDLPVGDYDVQTEKSGFQTVDHRGITLNAGADVVVDFSLPVGQVTQAVTVEGDVTQVETASAAISTVVQPVQMRDLPLNGRDFEQLILLSPGVVNNNGAGAAKNSFTGNSNYWSVSGSRSNGQGELLDGTDIQNYQNRGAGSGILGTTLGVDSIAEFQMLTNTYGAQYGGNGSVVNAVTRSGTNNFHGSAYEFLRNSALDAQNFGDPYKLSFKRNQFGGTMGGPIKKDKMFFFVNYEGLRQNLGVAGNPVVPDANTLQGYIPSTGAPGGCNIPAPLPGYVSCGPGSSNAANFAKIQPYLNLYASATAGLAMTEVLSSTGTPTGTARVGEPAQEPGTEDFVVGRYDWTLSSNDSLFGRYLFDNARLAEPFYGAFPQYPNLDRTRNQYFTLGEKHIFSSNIINALNLGYTRTFLDIHSQGELGSPLDWSGDIFTQKGEPVMDGALNPGSSISSIGPGQISPIRYGQNKFGVADDVFWNKGAHSLRFGGSAFRYQTNGLHPFPGGGTWTFTSLQNFLTDNPSQFQGPCNYYNSEPGCVLPNGTPFPLPSSQHDMRETDFSIYAQDDWKVSSTFTFNLGLRYEPTSNAYDAFNQIYMLLPVPYGPNGNLPPALGSSVPTTLTPAHNFMLQNPSLHNFDPRVGIAWDPFKDHKTSVRAGYGIFHAVLSARDYSYGAFFALPWVVKTVQYTPATNTFPLPFQGAVASGGTSMTWGTDPFITTPYLQQWNLSVQRQVMKNTVLTLAYVGSHGVHMIDQRDLNPPVPVGGLTQTGVGGISLNNGQLLWPSFAGETQNLVFTTGTGSFNPNGTITCGAAAGCTLATSTGAPLVDPTTGLQSFSHIVQTTTAPAASQFSILSNTHQNPNFSYMNGGVTDGYSHYNALQAGLVRQMTNNLMFQVSYTYSDCVDISSGNWSQEGGTENLDAYDVGVDRGPCVFMIRHSLTTNGLYLLPFQKNRLVSGWQLGGIFSFNTGGPFNPVTFANGSTDIGTAPNRANYVVNAPGCNGQPINSDPVTGRGVFYLNQSCFAAPAVGEIGNVGRDEFFAPHAINLDTNLTKNTKISEELTVQFRAEFFNVINRRNYANPGFPALVQGAGSSVTSIATGITNSSFGQITSVLGYPLNGSAREIQFGLKFIF
jgi:outer membrane receptor protein involved in Fe transport